MIIGITGPIASGKSILSETLSEKGFTKLSLSDEVREEAKLRNISIERKNLQDLGNLLRKEKGKGYWAERLIDKIIPKKDYIIEGIRNPGEIEVLRKLSDFVLVGINAPIEKRFQLIISRNKSSDPKTLEEIKEMDERDLGKGEDHLGQQTKACFELADHFIENKSTIQELKENFQDLLEKIKNNKP